MAKGIGASLGSGLAGITKSLDEMGAELDAEEAEVRQCVFACQNASDSQHGHVLKYAQHSVSKQCMNQ